MPYPEMLVAPMRKDLVNAGFQELRTADEVDAALGATSEPTMLVVNSVCGCAAGGMRPAVVSSLVDDGGPRPAVLATVFAGQDVEATNRAREYLVGYPPSSPSVALLRDGEVVWMLERHQIEGHHPHALAAALKEAYAEHCGPATATT